MTKILSHLLITLLLTGCMTTKPDVPISSVEISLPSTIEWDLITNNDNSSSALSEWVPKGSNGMNTKWIIVKQKFTFDSNVSAEDYIKGIFSSAKKACNKVRFFGPRELATSNYETYFGRFICSKQNGKDYGTFTDQRVISDGNNIYVVTSELRSPPSSSNTNTMALSFDKTDPNAMSTFFTRLKESEEFIHESITVCNNNLQSCNKNL